MSYTATYHPTEETLCACAMHEADEELLSHLEQCPECSEYVEEVRTISQDIAAIEDEPLPERLNAKIMAITRCKEKSRVVTILQTWYKNPFLIGILTVAMVLLLYALVMMMP